MNSNIHQPNCSGFTTMHAMYCVWILNQNLYNTTKTQIYKSRSKTLFTWFIIVTLSSLAKLFFVFLTKVWFTDLLYKNIFKYTQRINTLYIHIYYNTRSLTKYLNTTVKVRVSLPWKCCILFVHLFVYMCEFRIFEEYHKLATYIDKILL